MKLTTGDKIGIGTTLASLVGKGKQAFTKPDTVQALQSNTPVSRVKFNSREALSRNNLNTRSAAAGIRTGNASTDNALKTNLHAQKMQSDSEILRDYETRNQGAQVQYEERLASKERFNLQQRDIARERTAQNKGASDTAKDTFYNSLANAGTTVQNALNTKKKNNLSLASLNSLSTQFNIPIEHLMSVMNGEGGELVKKRTT